MLAAHTVFRFAVFLSFWALCSVMTMPFGYMPARAADGTVILRICTGLKPAPAPQRGAPPMHSGHGMAQTEQHTLAVAMADISLVGDMSGEDHASHGDEPHEMRCDYAVASAVDLPLAALIGEPVAAIPLRRIAPRTALTGIFPEGLPPATGPPAA